MNATNTLPKREHLPTFSEYLRACNDFLLRSDASRKFDGVYVPVINIDAGYAFFVYTPPDAVDPRETSIEWLLKFNTKHIGNWDEKDAVLNMSTVRHRYYRALHDLEFKVHGAAYSKSNDDFYKKEAQAVLTQLKDLREAEDATAPPLDELLQYVQVLDPDLRQWQRILYSEFWSGSVYGMAKLILSMYNGYNYQYAFTHCIGQMDESNLRIARKVILGRLDQDKDLAADISLIGHVLEGDGKIPMNHKPD